MQPWHKHHFIKAIEHLQQHASSRHFAGDLSLAEVFHHRRGFAQDLANEVSQRQYCFSPAEQVVVRQEGKDRSLYRPEVLDAVVERVLSQWLNAQLSNIWPASLYSYRKDYSSARAIAAFAHALRKHQKHRPDPRERGLWVLRRDIKSYGESIPLDARLWSPLEACLKPKNTNKNKNKNTDIGLSLLHAFLPRHFRTPDSTTTQILEQGTPTGTPIQPAINNFYLLSLDKRILAEPGFYARFGDDFIYACESPQQGAKLSAIISETLSELGLALSPGKCEDIYFNGSGHQNKSEPWPSRTTVDFLGSSLSFTGSIRLRNDKALRLRRELKARLRTTANALATLEPEPLVTHLGQVVRTALDLSSPLVLSDAQALWTLVDDRSQFKELDKWLQRTVVELVLKRGIRGFRRLAPSQLYELGLPSLTAQKNIGQWSHGVAHD